MTICNEYIIRTPVDREFRFRIQIETVLPQVCFSHPLQFPVDHQTQYEQVENVFSTNQNAKYEIFSKVREFQLHGGHINMSKQMWKSFNKM